MVEKKSLQKEVVNGEKTPVEITFGNLFSATFNEYTEKFKIIGRTFLFLYLVPLIVLAVLGIIVMIVTFPFLSISGNAIVDATSGGLPESTYESGMGNIFEESLVFRYFELDFET